MGLSLSGTVIPAIWWQIVLLLLYTGILTTFHNSIQEINYPQSLISVLGVVTGLLLVFRTNTAYDRYWEGRKIWSQMTYSIRSLTRCIWNQVNAKTEAKDASEGETPKEPDNPTQILIEKATAINLLVAFAYATRNYLREVYSYDEEEIQDLINHLPKLSTPSSVQPLAAQESFLASSSQKAKKVFGAIRINVEESNSGPKQQPKAKRTASKIRKKKITPTASLEKAYETSVPTNIPIEISYYISSFIAEVYKRELCDMCTEGNMYRALDSLVECLGGFERIRRTPIPLAYSVHLYCVTWIYLLALPFQLIGTLNWFTLPAVSLASFALLGILTIAIEIENPFGYDENDLPLDDYCRVIHKEAMTIMSHPTPPIESWMMSSENHPFAPQCMATAKELLEMKEEDVRLAMGKGTRFRLTTRFEPNGNQEEEDVVDLRSFFASAAPTTPPNNVRLSLNGGNSNANVALEKNNGKS